MKWIFVFLLPLAVTAAAQQTDTAQHIAQNNRNAKHQQQKPYGIRISGDGLRNDLVDSYGATHIQQYARQGVAAAYMTPSFPSLTFPNHYSIITGLYPSHHGLLNNRYYDRKRQEFYDMGNKKMVAEGSRYGGTPLWVLCEQQGLLSASYFWVASEAAIQGVRPTYYFTYNNISPIDNRIRTVKSWLQLPAEKRPHFITFYFPDVDHNLHHYGVGSEKGREAVRFVDESIGKLVRTVDSLGLPVNYIVVSDHGMTNIDPHKTLPLPRAIDSSRFIIPNGDAVLYLYAKDKKDIRPTYKALKKEAAGKQGYSVHLLNKTPKYWRLRKKDDRFAHAGDIILLARPPYIFDMNPRSPVIAGYHGFDNHHPDMRASFYAWGPAFKKGIEIKGFENVHVYPLIAHLLGLSYKHRVDGKLKVLQPALAATK